MTYFIITTILFLVFVVYSLIKVHKKKQRYTWTIEGSQFILYDTKELVPVKGWIKVGPFYMDCRDGIVKTIHLFRKHSIIAIYNSNNYAFYDKENTISFDVFKQLYPNVPHLNNFQEALAFIMRRYWNLNVAVE